MLGPLPPLHRWLVCALAVLASVGTGAWLTLTLRLPLLVTTGAAVGAVLGALLVVLLLHNGAPPGRSSRVRRTH